MTKDAGKQRPARPRSAWLLYLSATIAFLFVMSFRDEADHHLAVCALLMASSAAALSVVLLGRAVSTLLGGSQAEKHPTPQGASRHLLEEEKTRLLGAIKELDFDHAMGKIDDRDHRELRSRYEDETLRVIAKLDDDMSLWRERAESLAHSYITAARREQRALSRGDGAKPSKDEPTVDTPGAET